MGILDKIQGMAGRRSDEDLGDLFKQVLSEGRMEVFRYSATKNVIERFEGDHFEPTGRKIEYIKKTVHPAHRKKFEFLHNNLVSGKMTKGSAEFLMLDSKTNLYKYKHHSYNTYNEKDVKPEWVYCISKDQDEKHQQVEKLDNVRRWLEMVVQACDLMVWNYDTYEGRFVYPEQSFERYSKFEYLNDIIRCVHPDDRKSMDALADVFRRKRNKAINLNMRIDYTGTGKNWSYVKFYGIPDTLDDNGDVKVYSGYIRNMSNIIDLEKQLAVVTEKADKSEMMKDLFVQNISHYVRTPLNSIMGFAQMVGDCSTEEEKAICLQQMKQNNDDLLRYLNDLLEYSTILAGYMPLQMEVFNACNILEEECATVATRVMETIPVEIKYERPVSKIMIEWDKERFQKIYNRLAKNALRFTRQGEVILRLHPTTEGVMMQCEYTAICPNIAEGEDMYSSFDKPDFMDSLDSLELCLCRLTVERNHGVMSARTTDNTSVFTVNIPCRIVNIEN